MTVLARLNQYGSLLGREFDETTANNIGVTGLGTFYSSEFIENVGITTVLTTRTFLTYDPVSDDFIGDPLSDALGGSKGTYMRYNTDKSVVIYEDIDEITDYRNIVTDGLVLDLDASSSRSYNGSGTTWTDLSSSGNNGTLVNGVGYSSINGGVLSFDGSDDYVSETVGLSDSFWQGSWTANFWVNFDTLNTTTGNSDKTLLQHGTPGLRQGLHLTQRNSRILFGLFSDDVSGTTVLNTGRWYNVTFVLNNTSYLKQIYLNGALDNSNTGGGAYIGTGTNTRIGGTVLTFGLTFDGFMGGCNFYNRALTASEVLQNYNALKSFYGLS